MKRWRMCMFVLIFLIAFTGIISPQALAGDDDTQIITSAWARDEIQKAQDLGLIPYWVLGDYTVPITREQYVDLALEYVALQQHCDSGSLRGLVKYYLAEPDEDGYSIKNIFADGDEDSSIAYYLGLVEGSGNNHFDTKGLLTRQEAAVMLTRAYATCGGDLPKNVELGFTDVDMIADWAKESITALAAWGVMKGTEDGTFSPNGNFTIEQCIVTLVRLYENAPVSRISGNVDPLFTYQQGLEYVVSFSKYNTERFRICGPYATFIRIDGPAVIMSSSTFYFVYHDGGVLSFDPGIQNVEWGFSPFLEMDNPVFSEDGKFFSFSVTLEKDVYSWEDKLRHEKGIYRITVDVDTGRHQFVREDLPD